jgi:hypothetical protein
MRLTGCEAEVHWQAIGVRNGVNLARKSASRPAHVLSEREMTASCFNSIIAASVSVGLIHAIREE